MGVSKYFNERDLKKDIDNYVRAFMNAYTREAAKELTKVAQWSVLEFYAAYTPDVYDRTDDFKKNSYTPYLKQGTSKNTWYGGVRLTSRKMQDYKSADAFTVAQLAFHGWHGDPTGYNGRFDPIHSRAPIDMIEKVVRNNTFIDSLRNTATKEAERQSYKCFRFI